MGVESSIRRLSKVRRDTMDQKAEENKSVYKKKKVLRQQSLSAPHHHPIKIHSILSYSSNIIIENKFFYHN